MSLEYELGAALQRVVTRLEVMADLSHKRVFVARAAIAIMAGDPRPNSGEGNHGQGMTHAEDAAWATARAVALWDALQALELGK